MPPKPHNNPIPAPQIIPTPEILLPVIAGLTRNLIPLVIAGFVPQSGLFVMLNLIQHPVSGIPDNVIPDLIRDLFST